MGADFDSDEDALPTPKRVDPPTDFVGAITCNSMLRLLRAIPSLLGAHPDAPSAALRLLRMRMLPFFEVLPPLLWQDCRQACVALVLELLEYEKTYAVARQYLEQWSMQVDGNVWKDDLDEEIRHLVCGLQGVHACTTEPFDYVGIDGQLAGHLPAVQVYSNALSSALSRPPDDTSHSGSLSRKLLSLSSSFASTKITCFVFSGWWMESSSRQNNPQSRLFFSDSPMTIPRFSSSPSSAVQLRSKTSIWFTNCALLQLSHDSFLIFGFGMPT